MKALKQHRLLDSPDRLKFPLKKVGGRHVRISWEQALAESGAKVRQLPGDFSTDAIAMYVGTAAGFGVLHPIFVQGFMTGLGSKSMSRRRRRIAPTSSPSRATFMTSRSRSRSRISIAPSACSSWARTRSSRSGASCRSQTRRSGSRRSKARRRDRPAPHETAKVASEWVPIRPGSDVFFFLSFLHELFAQGGVDGARVALHASGELARWLSRSARN